MGYNAEKGVFTHYGVDSNGWSGYAEGVKSGNTFTFKSKDVMGGKTYHTRFTMELATPTEMKFSWEVSEDGENFMVLMDGGSKKN